MSRDLAEHEHGGQPCDPSEAAAIRQFEVEAVTPGPQYQPRTISDRAAFRAWLAKALGATITKRRPSWASDTVQGLVAAGEYDAAAEAIDRLLAESTPAAPDEDSARSWRSWAAS
jgi:hypothetical protein